MSGGLSPRFLEYIVASIDEDAARLAWSDWLAENGQDDRAEFVRVQVGRARLPSWDAAQVGLRLREAELLRRHGEEWLAEMPAIDGARWEGFRRGVVAEVSFASFEALRTNAQACRAVAPVEAIRVRWPRRGEDAATDAPIAELRELHLTGRPGVDEVQLLSESPQLASLRVLTAGGLGTGLMRALAASPHLARLKALRLPAQRLDDGGIQALIGARSLAALEELDLAAQGVAERYSNDPILSASGLAALAHWAGLASVRSLSVSGNAISRVGLRALLRSRHLGALRTLSLRDCRLDGQAMAEFRDAASGLGLDLLDLGENLLRDVGAEYLAIVPCLRDLKALRLDRCEITLDGARLFARKAGFLGGLRQLDVGHNHFGTLGLGALLERGPLVLHTLGLRDNNLFDKGTRLLAASPASASLLELDLGQNGLGTASAEALGESAHLDKLLILRLVDNPLIGPGGEARLAASPLGRRLAVLELRDEMSA